MPGFAGAKNRSFDQPYIVAKDSDWPGEAEKVKETEAPGKITAGEPVPMKVPDSTRFLESSTFSTVMVRAIGMADIPGSFLQETARLPAAARRTSNTLLVFDFILMTLNCRSKLTRTPLAKNARSSR